MWRFGIGAARPPPPLRNKSLIVQKKGVINYTMSTSVNVLSSNLGQVGVRGYVMKGQQT